VIAAIKRHGIIILVQQKKERDLQNV